MFREYGEEWLCVQSCCFFFYVPMILKLSYTVGFTGCPGESLAGEAMPHLFSAVILLWLAEFHLY